MGYSEENTPNSKSSWLNYLCNCFCKYVFKEVHLWQMTHSALQAVLVIVSNGRAIYWERINVKMQIKDHTRKKKNKKKQLSTSTRGKNHLIKPIKMNQDEGGFMCVLE